MPIAGDFIVKVFGASTTGSVYLCSLPNADARGPDEPGEQHLITRDLAKAKKFIEKWDRARRGVYYCVSTIKQGATRRAKETLAELNGLFVDVDFKSIEEHPDKVDQALRETYLPPTFVVASGNGRHAYWLFKEALPAAPETIARIEKLLRLLADCLGGDPAVCHPAALMRLPGSHNTKRDAWTEVTVLTESGIRYEPDELEEWLTVYAAPTLHTKPKGPNGKTDHGDSPWLAAAQHAGVRPPVDVEQRLRDMRLGGPGDSSIHATQVSVSAALLTRGMSTVEVVAKLLEATRAAAGPAGEAWDWRREERDLERMCETWSEKRAGRQGQTSAQAGEGVSLNDFHAYMPAHSYIFAPSREMWPSSSVNARLPPIRLVDKEGKPLVDQEGKQKTVRASAWLDEHRPVEQATWAPGLPTLIRDRLISDGGWITRNKVTCFNLYRPPTIGHGDAGQAGQWLEHAERVFGDAATHIVAWLAHRVQRPQEKINHALVLGGAQGVGKDTLLEPVKQAIGPWNFAEVSPKQMLGRFNGFLKSVVLRLSEARDLGEVDRFAFYDHMKAYTAAPPDVLRVDEKHLREHAILNCVGIIVTTNHKADGIFLPPDDRRHFVAWTDLTRESFTPHYWNDLWRWYAAGGHRHVAAYLAELDISSFDPKAPPPKTPAFWEIVDAGRAPENAELADVLDKIGNPDAVTLADLVRHASGDILDWLSDRKNRRAIPYRVEQCGYVPVRNDAAKDGLWKVNDKRSVIYARQALPAKERATAVTKLISERDSGHR